MGAVTDMSTASKTAKAATGRVHRVTIPPAMDAALVRRAAKNGVSVSAYIVEAVHQAMDRDMFAEMDAEMEGGR